MSHDTTISLRRARAEDLSAIHRLALDNSIFAPDELDDIDEQFAGYLDHSLPHDQWLVAESEVVGGTAAAAIIGAAYVAPEPFSDRLWNLYFLAVSPDLHGAGVGTTVLNHVEATLRDMGPDTARILLIETSSTDQYASTRTFYASRGYTHEARIREFYGPGDDKVVFWKALH